jgi:signal transduction histidine kinase
VRLRAQGGNAQLIVSDTGPGIPESELRYAFDHVDSVRAGACRQLRPHRVRAAIRARAGATAERIDRCAERAGRGTSFTVLLPLGTRDFASPASGQGHVERTGLCRE